jgi:hypothetical protein
MHAQALHLEGVMSHIKLIIVCALLGACAAQPQQDQSDAVKDFIEVNELTEVSVIRTMKQYEYDRLSDGYVIVEANRKFYLVQLFGRCREISDTEVSPDFRRDSKALRAGEDTIRGCRIQKIYPIEDVQAQELENIGEAPGEDRQ